MKKIILILLNWLGYDIIKFKNLNKYKVPCKLQNIKHYITPIGNYYLPDTDNDTIINTMRQGLLFEPKVIELCLKYIKKDSIVLDVGANCGQMSLEFAKKAKTVYAFEPQEIIYKCLCRNVVSNIIPVNIACGDTNGIIGFESGDKYGTYGINPDGLEKVYCYKIDTWIPDSLKIGFIKIDAQGYDLFVMKGAINTIQRCQMPIIFEYCEYLSIKFGVGFQNYIDFIENIGYKFTETWENNYVIIPK